MHTWKSRLELQIDAEPDAGDKDRVGTGPGEEARSSPFLIASSW